MNRTLQNVPLAVDPNSKDQFRVNRELTEVIRQLWQKVAELQRLHDKNAADIKKLNQQIP